MILNRDQLKKKFDTAVYELLKDKDFISPVDLLLRMDVLKDKDYKDWRFGRVPYLEKVCGVNLAKLSSVMKELRIYAKQNNLKESFTVYKRWGVKGKVIPLRFSKTGHPEIEKAYSTHYVKINDDS
jgi:hypothetical protein